MDITDGTLNSNNTECEKAVELFMVGCEKAVELFMVSVSSEQDIEHGVHDAVVAVESFVVGLVV